MWFWESSRSIRISVGGSDRNNVAVTWNMYNVWSTFFGQRQATKCGRNKDETWVDGYGACFHCLLSLRWAWAGFWGSICLGSRIFCGVTKANASKLGSSSFTLLQELVNGCTTWPPRFTFQLRAIKFSRSLKADTTRLFDQLCGISETKVEALALVIPSVKCRWQAFVSLGWMLIYACMASIAALCRRAVHFRAYCEVSATKTYWCKTGRYLSSLIASWGESLDHCRSFWHSRRTYFPEAACSLIRESS